MIASPILTVAQLFANPYFTLNNRSMKLIPLFLISFLTINALGQQSKNFELIDKFKLDGIQTKVFFNDPLKDLLNSYPDFDKKEDKEKYDLLDEYLHQNSLYVFQTIKKNGETKSYVLKGKYQKSEDCPLLQLRNIF